MNEAAEIRYAETSDGVHVAYQVSGEGPIDLIQVLNGTNFSIDAAGDQPRWQGYLDRLASFSRLIQFDPRGIGLSDPASASAPLTIEQLATDALAVLDDAGSDQGAVMGVGLGGAPAVFLSAAHPSRVRALVLVGGFARILRAEGYPAGVPVTLWERFASSLVETRREMAGGDDLPLMAPSLANDASFRDWWRRAGRRGASPNTARLFLETTRDTDVRSLLGVIQVPTLILQARDEAFVRAGHGRYLAEHIPGARYVELPTEDHLPWTSGVDYAGEIEEFLTGVRRGRAMSRVLTTVVFTDIVGSTERASDVGDRVWKERLDQHDEMTARQVRRFDGRVVKTIGDGTLVTFDGPARAIQAAIAIRDAVRQLGIELRVGIHTGEVELRDADIAGISVHIGQRVQAVAQPGEVLVSRTVVDLVAGSGIEFEDRGEHKLKGVPGAWRLFAVQA